MSGVGNCYDNAPMESFWARMKHELRGEMLFDDLRHARKVVYLWVHLFYNRKRMHSSLNYKTPLEFEEHNRNQFSDRHDNEIGETSQHRGDIDNSPLENIKTSVDMLKSRHVLVTSTLLMLFAASRCIYAQDTLFIKDSTSGVEVPTILISVGDTVTYASTATSSPYHSKLYWSSNSGLKWDSLQTTLTLNIRQRPMKWVGVAAITSDPEQGYRQTVHILFTGGRQQSFATTGNGIPDDLYVQSLYLHPTVYGRCYAIAKKQSSIDVQHLFVLDAHTGTWRNVPVPGPSRGGGRLLHLELDYNDDSTLWLRIDGDHPLFPVGPYDYVRSTDHGQTWTLLERPFLQLMGLFGPNVGVTSIASLGTATSLVLENVVTADSSVFNWSESITEALSRVTNVSDKEIGFSGIGDLPPSWDSHIYFDAQNPDRWIIAGHVNDSKTGQSQYCRLATKNRGLTWDLFAGPTVLLHEDSTNVWFPIPVLTNSQTIFMPYYTSLRDNGVSGPVTSSGLIRFNGVTTGVKSLHQLSERVTAYPQPASDMVILEGLASCELVEVVSVDVLGNAKQLRYDGSSDRLFVDVSELSSGTYHLLIRTREGTTTCRVVITR